VILRWPMGLPGRASAEARASMSERSTLLERTRERALGVSLRWMTLGLLPVLGIMTLQALLDRISLTVVFGLARIMLPVPILYWTRKSLGHARTTRLLLITMFVAVLYQETQSGFTPGAALVSNSLILLSTLLFGERAYRWFLLACLGNLALGWFLHTSGVGVQEGWKFSDPGRPLVWVRHALVLTFLGGAIREMSLDVRALEQEKLLNELGGVLASSLDAEQTLAEVSRRVVRHFAELCMIELRNGGPTQLHVTARAPERAWLADALRGWPNPNDPRLDCEVWRTRQAEIVKVTHDYLESHSQGPEHLALLEALQARSIMSAPMISRGHMFGVLVAVSSTRRYDQQDLQLLAQIAERAAMALENALLHDALQEAHADVNARFGELQEAHAKIRTLTGLLPVCAWCGRIRDERHAGQWKRFDQFVIDHTAADVSHTICPDCVSAQRHKRSGAASHLG
jgi:hypothetical protein